MGGHGGVLGLEREGLKWPGIVVGFWKRRVPCLPGYRRRETGVGRYLSNVACAVGTLMVEAVRPRCAGGFWRDAGNDRHGTRLVTSF